MLSCDGISSAAYGSEEILRALLPFFGLVAFTLVLPMTLVILFGIALVVLSYAEVLEDLGDGTLPGPPPNYGRRSVIVLIDRLDLAALAALRYANSLRPTKFRAVHFVLDGARADRLREAWVRARLDVPLDLVDCADRRLAQAAAELAAAEAGRDDTHVTVVLPRRGYSLLARRLLHDHTADKIAHAVSRIPDSAATIIPFDVQHAVNALGRGKPHSPRLHLAAPLADAAVQAHDRPAVPPGAVPIGSLAQADRSTVEGRVHRDVSLCWSWVNDPGDHPTISCAPRTTGRPRAPQSLVPPAADLASMPRWSRNCAAVQLRFPDAQIT